MPKFSELEDDYSRKWNGMVVDSERKDEFRRTARRLIAHKAQYREVEAKTGVPWALIAVIHFREADADFTKHLYNGDPLTARTLHVPDGLPAAPAEPPFTFLQSAVGALERRGLNDVPSGAWNVEQAAYQLEHYNGWGYFKRQRPSAYLWAGSNIYLGGKFIGDHQFDPSIRDRQLGCMPLLAAMIAEDATIGFSPPSVTPDEETHSVNIQSLVAVHWYKLGDEGDAVRLIQLALAKLGYPLRGTGYFGQATDAAVTDFQEDLGLEVDGVVGPETAKALDERVGGGVVVSDDHPPEIEHVVADNQPMWLKAALRLVNIKEIPGPKDNPVLIEWAEEIGGEIEAVFKHDSIPWCALFVNYVLTRTGEKGPGTLWALDFAKWGQKLNGPAVGAIVAMRRKGGGHVAIVVGKDRHGQLVCVGGNQDDKVCIRTFPVDRIVAYRWPAHLALPAKTGVSSLPRVSADGASVNEA